MAEGESSLGNISVGVDVELKIANEEQFVSKVEAATARGQRGKGGGTPGNGAATGGLPNQSINADLKIDGKDVVNSIQKALDSHEFKLVIDVEFLKKQIQNAFNGMELPLSAAPGQAQVHGAPAIESTLGHIPEEIKKAFAAGGKGLSGAIDEFNDAVEVATKATGRGGLGGGTQLDRLTKAISMFGGNFGSDTSGLSDKAPGANKAVVESFDKIASRLGIQDKEQASRIGVYANQLRIAAANTPLISQVQALASQRSTAPAAVPAPAPVDREAVVAATHQKAADEAQAKVERLTAEAKSNLAPIGFRRVPSPRALLDLVTGTSGIGPARSRSRRGQAQVDRIAGPNLPTGEDPEADRRALEHLGLRTDRGQINFGALRAGSGPADPDLRSLAVAAARGQLSNFVRNKKTGEFTRLNPVGDVGTSERAESEDRIRDLLKSRKETSIPGLEGRVVPQSPREIINRVVEELYGTSGTQFLQTPRVQAELAKAVRAGGSIKQAEGIQTGGFRHVAAAGPSEIAAALADEEAARASGSGIDRETAAANRRQSNLESQERIASGFGKSPSDLAADQLRAFFPKFVKASITAKSLPDFNAIPGRLVNEVEGGDFERFNAPRREQKLTPLSSQQFAGLRVKEIKDLFLKGGGENLTKERASEVLGVPVNEEQTDLFREGLPNKSRLKTILGDLLGSVSGGIAPAPGRKELAGGRLERGVPFATTDANQKDVLTGRGVLVGDKIPETTLQRRETDLRKQLANAKEAEAIASGLAKKRKEEEGVDLQITPQDTSGIKAELGQVQAVRSRVAGILFPRDIQVPGRNAKETPEFPNVGVNFPLAGGGKEGVDFENIKGLPTGGDAIKARASAITSLFKLGPEGGQETEEMLRGLAIGGRLTSTGKVRYAPGDDLRRAAAKTSTVGGPVPPIEDTRSFTAVNAALGGVAGGGAGGGSGRGVVPPGAGGRMPEVTGAIHVIVDNEVLRVSVAGGSSGVESGVFGSAPQGAANANATTGFRTARARLNKQTSTSAQAAFGRDVDRLRGQGLTDEHISRLAKQSGLGIAADTFFGTGEITGSGAQARGIAATRQAANVLSRAGALPPALATRLASPDITRQEAPIDPRVARLRAQENVARTLLTQRNIGTTLTVLGESLLGGRGAPLARFAAASNRIGDLANISGRRQQAEGVLTTQGDLITAYKKTIADYTAQGKKTGTLTTQLGNLEKAYDVQKSVVSTLSEAEKKVGDEAERLAKGVVTAKDVLRNFAGGIAGSALGIAAGLGVATLAQTAIAGVLAAAGPALDRAMGSPAVTSSLTRGIATAGAPGTFAAATAQQAAQAGIGPGGLTGLTQRGQAIAGNSALIQQFDLLRGELNVENQNRGLPPGVDRSTLQATGGVFGSGLGITGIGDFQVSAQQAIAEAINPLSSHKAAAEVFARTGNIDAGAHANMPQLAKDTALASAALKDFNKQIKAGGGTFQFAVTSDAAAVKKFSDSVRATGATELANAISAQNLTLTGGEATGANALTAVAAAQRASAGYNIESLLAASEPARRAQEGLRIQRINLTQQQVIPGQFGISNALAPLPTAAQAQGLLPGRDVSGITKSFQSVSDTVKSAVAGAKDFVATNLPDYGKAFANSLDAAAADANKIRDIQVGVQVQQAQLSADKFAYSLVVANRSLTDAKGLTGDIVKQNGENLGIIERQQFILGREAQSLSIYLSQLQINFQKSLAGFVSAGTTPEERAARIKEAKIEADLAQKQLDIQKEQFALGKPAFDISAGRQVRDLEKQISFLQRDYTLQLDTKAAELQVQGISKDLDLNAQKANALFGEAVQKVNDVYSLEAQLVAETGKSLAEVSKQVIDAFSFSYNQMITEINSGILSGYNIYNKSTSTTGTAHHAAGIVGMATGETTMTVGEAGNEAVAILKNPKSMIMPSGGTQPSVINITVSGNKFTTEEDQRQLVATLTTEVQRQMGRNAALLGLRRPL